MKFRSAHMARAWEWKRQPRPLKETQAEVSIVIPTSGPEYARRLKRCLKSIRKQTLHADQIEVIIVCLLRAGGEHDGADMSPERILCLDNDESRREAAGIRCLGAVVQYDHYPLCLAKNIGVLHARRQMVCITDADIIFDPEVLQRALTNGTPFTSVLTSYMDPHLDYEHLVDTRLDVFRKITRKGSISRSGYGGFLLVDRDTFLGVGGFDELYDAAWGADDSDLVDRLYKTCGVSDYSFLDVSYVDGIFMVHQWHPPRQDREGTMLNRLRYESVSTVERNLEGFGQLEVVEL